MSRNAMPCSRANAAEATLVTVSIACTILQNNSLLHCFPEYSWEPVLFQNRILVLLIRAVASRLGGFTKQPGFPHE